MDTGLDTNMALTAVTKQFHTAKARTTWSEDIYTTRTVATATTTARDSLILCYGFPELQPPTGLQSADGSSLFEGLEVG